MIRRLIFAAGALLASLPSQVAATPVMDKAVAATLYQNCLDFKASAPQSPVVCTDAMTSYGLALGTMKNDIPASSGAKSWWNIIRHAGLPQPIALSDGSPFFGGGGATGSWLPNEPPTGYCAKFRYKLSQDGLLIVPTLPLKTGGPMKRGYIEDPLYRWTYGKPDITHGGSSGYDAADSAEALVLWALHHLNKADTRATGDPPPQHWRGCYTKVANGCLFSTIPFTDGHGYHYQQAGTGSYPNIPAYYTFEDVNTKDCPEGGFAGGNVHFYAYGSGITTLGQLCTWYIPNPSLSASGYYYAEETALPDAAMDNFPASIPEAAECNLSADLVKRVAEKVRQKAETQGAPATKAVEHPKTGGQDPKVKDLADVAALDNSGTPTNPTPLPTQPGTGTGFQDECDFGANGCTDPGTPAANLEATPTGIMDPIFNWLPDLPSITLNNQSLQCPVWNVDLRDVMGPTAQFLLNSHCELMESGTLASTLSALMIAVFGIAAALIILRA